MMVSRSRPPLPYPHCQLFDLCASVYLYANHPLQVVVTNPPYSSDHPERLLRFVRRNGKPYLLLMPTYISTAEYYRNALVPNHPKDGKTARTGSTKSRKRRKRQQPEDDEEALPVFLCNRLRYDYVNSFPLLLETTCTSVENGRLKNQKTCDHKWERLRGVLALSSCPVFLRFYPS